MILNCTNGSPTRTLAAGAIRAVADGLTGALAGLGIPEDRAKVYNERVAKGGYLVMIDGTEAETQQAEAVLRRHNLQEWGLYDAAAVAATQPPQTSAERVASDADSTYHSHAPQVEQPHPNVVIMIAVMRRDCNTNGCFQCGEVQECMSVLELPLQPVLNVCFSKGKIAMKTLTSVLLSSLLLVSTVACNNVAKTSEQAPDSTNTTTQAPEVDEAQDSNKDASNEVRRKQLNADIRAREQRLKALGRDAERSDDDIKTQARRQLEANLPASQLTIDAEVRRKQLNADIRAREQRLKALGRDAERSDDDIKTQVRRQLEANLPASQLTVDAKDGNVSIAGTVPSQPQYQRIEPLAKAIYGVKTVAVKVTVVPAKPKS